MYNENVVAIVNGKEITTNDIMKFLNEMNPQTAAQFQSEEGIKRIIEELVNQELLYLDAIENGYENDVEFKEVLKTVKDNLLKGYAFNKIVDGIKVTDEEIANYYNEHSEMFKKQETLNASHILVDDEEKAYDIIDMINEGLEFEKAAEQYSTCPSKEVGGNLGEFAKGQMVPEFENAAFKLEIGEMSEPVKTQFGYHIIKINEKSAEDVYSLEEVRDEIEKQLLMSKQEEKYLNKVNSLKIKYPVNIL